MSNYPTTTNAQGVEIVDTSDAAWATYIAEGRDQLAKSEAECAEARHQMEMAKAAGLSELAQVRHDPDVVAAARVLHNADPAGPSVDELIEAVMIPIREKYVAAFSDNAAPTARHVPGENEQAFNRLMGGDDDASS